MIRMYRLLNILFGQQMSEGWKQHVFMDLEGTLQSCKCCCSFIASVDSLL